MGKNITDPMYWDELEKRIMELETENRQLTNARPSFEELSKNIVSFLADFREIHDFVKDKKRPEDIYEILDRLSELTDFIHDVAIPAIGLQLDFWALKESIMAKQEKAPAAVAAAAGA